MSDITTSGRYISRGVTVRVSQLGDKKINQTCEKAIADFLRGDRDALAIIYDSMARMIFSVSYSITESYQDAEDVLQDTMIEIAKYAHNYRSGSNAKAWIMAMARHRSIDVIRKRKKVVSADDMNPDNTSGSPYDFSRLEVLDMLNTLDEEKRQIIVLRLYAELPYKDISSVMGLSVSAAQKKYQRAIRTLKDYFRRIGY